MKSLLVDALRQANSSQEGQSLSDSGSFDTTNAEFETTANDPVAVDETASAEELALYETTIDAALNADAINDEPLQDANFDEPSESLRPADSKQSIADENTRPGFRQSQQAMPALARFAPVVCVSAALIAAASWALFRGTELGRDGLTMLELQSSGSSHESRQNGPAAANTAAERFPFLESDNQAESVESSE